MHKLFLFTILIVSFASCTQFEYEHSISVPDAKWALTDTLKFNLEIADTIKPKNLYVKLKHTETYLNQNLWLFIQVISPNGNQYTDTMELQLADHRGKWYGKKWLGEYRLLHPYKQHFKFTQTGNYQFNMVHGIRKDTLQYITDIGLSLK